MLVESLSAGRGVSLPALGTACGHLATLTTSAYATIRRQFGLSIGRFEGVQEALARIAGLTYQLEAARRLTCTGLDMGQRPGIITAIAKYHMTEMARQVLNDAMDVHAGRGVQCVITSYSIHYTKLYECEPVRFFSFVRRRQTEKKWPACLMRLAKLQLLLKRARDKTRNNFV